MKILEKLKSKALELKKQITVLYYAYQDPGLGILPKLIIVFTVAYALSPVDLIPDFIPILGYLDDLLIIPALISLSIKLIPHDIMENAAKKYENEPVKLKKNWIVGVFIILIWVCLILVLLYKVIKRIRGFK